MTRSMYHLLGAGLFVGTPLVLYFLCSTPAGMQDALLSAILLGMGLSSVHMLVGSEESRPQFEKWLLHILMGFCLWLCLLGFFLVITKTI